MHVPFHTLTLEEIQTTEWNDSTHYFPDVPHDMTYLGCALAGEVGEVCNEIKKNFRGSIDIFDLRNKLTDELPDVLIYLVMLASAMDIDLTTAYKAKKEYNRARYSGSTEVR